LATEAERYSPSIVWLLHSSTASGKPAIDNCSRHTTPSKNCSLRRLKDIRERYRVIRKNWKLFRLRSKKGRRLRDRKRKMRKKEPRREVKMHHLPHL